MALNTYLDREKEKAKQGMIPDLVAPKPLTQAGSEYQKRVTQNLLTPNPVVKQAEQQTDTDISRRNYLTRKQAQEDIAQSPFGAGTQQATRLMDQSRAGANQANLNQRQNLNLFSLNTAERDLNRAGVLEDSAFTKARGLEETDYTRRLAERTNQQIERGRYSGLIEDPKARYAFNRMVAGGMDPAEAYSSIVGDTGSISEDYRGLTPVGTMQEDARQWVEATTDLQPGSPEFEAAVRDRITSVDAARREPLDDATRLRDEEDKSMERISTAIESGDFSGMASSDWDKITPTQIQQAKESGAIKEWETSKPSSPWKEDESISTSEAKEKFKETHPYEIGDIVEKDGKLYEITDDSHVKSTREWEYGTRQTRKRIQIKAKPVSGGEEINLYTSIEFDPD